jgi:hypothetical protein
MDAGARRRLNELLLVEESAEAPGGGYMSRFELFRDGMLRCGADTTAIDQFTHLLESDENVLPALTECGAPRASIAFWRACGAAASRSDHAAAAVIAVLRNEVLPSVFAPLSEELERYARRAGRFVSHETRPTPRMPGVSASALQLVATLCDADEQRWAEAQRACEAVLDARLFQWDALIDQVRPLQLAGTH